jgi:hypothetical protein
MPVCRSVWIERGHSAGHRSRRCVTPPAVLLAAVAILAVGVPNGPVALASAGPLFLSSTVVEMSCPDTTVSYASNGRVICSSSSNWASYQIVNSLHCGGGGRCTTELVASPSSDFVFFGWNVSTCVVGGPTCGPAGNSEYTVNTSTANYELSERVAGHGFEPWIYGL